MFRKTLSFRWPYALTSLVLVCSLMTSTAAAPDAQTITDSVTVPISGTVFDCAGNPVTISGEVHTVTHTTVSSSGQINIVFHLNQNLQGISADGTRHVMNQQVQETITADTTDGFPVTQTFVIHSNLNNNDPNVPQMHLKATVHATVNANGEITGVQVLIDEECQG